MYGVQKQQLRNLGKKEFVAMQALCRLAKNMYNVGLYNTRQHYFETGEFLYYGSNNQRSKTNENYQLLNTDAAQQILKKVEENFFSFFGLLKTEGKKARIPKYLPKEDYFEITFPRIKVQADGTFFLPMSPAFKRQYGRIQLTFPTNVDPNQLAEIRIQPKADASYFDIEYVYKVQAVKEALDPTHIMAMDFGLNNLASIVTTNGASFILDGKPLKSKNRWYNKCNADIQSTKDKQGLTHMTKRQQHLLVHRMNFVNDYLNKATRYLVDYCLQHQIGTMVVGYNKGWKQEMNIGKRNNQNFVQIPHGKFKMKLKAMCERYGIIFIEQEESYTSKASFLDGDVVPIYEVNNTVKHTFSGRRVQRGLYRSKEGHLVNADINGACNILVKTGLVFDFEKMVKTCRQNPKKITLLQKKSEHRPSVASVYGAIDGPNGKSTEKERVSLSS